MKITTTRKYGRQGWELSNDKISLFLMAGGGHIADLRLRENDKINPLWVPVWQTIEPWQYRAPDARRYGSKLLAAIFGHNLCLGSFGEPSAEEERAGLGNHGEAPVARWRRLKQSVAARRLQFVYGCELPIARMKLERAVMLEHGSYIVRVKERLTSLARCDVPFTMCQHVTFGAPFVEPGVTLFDMSATEGHTFPGEFSGYQRLKSDKKFTWPNGPGPGGRVDLRRAGLGSNSDFSANLMTRSADHAWFSALNPRQGLMVAYVWRRADYPWVGVWEENRSRTESPWGGKSITRGMEFTNTPFPVGLRQAVDRGMFQGERTYRWLPARSSITFDYSLMTLPAEKNAKGVCGIKPAAGGFEIDWLQ